MSLLSANLLAFIKVIQVTTVHGAARELGLTQTGVTQRIRVLERELKTTLFLRSRKGMRLTQDGEALYRYCRAALDLEGRTLSEMASHGKQLDVFLSLAGPTSTMISRVVPQTCELHKKWPGLLLNYVIEDHKNRVDMVKRGEAQLAIVSHDQVPKEMESKILKPDKYILVASSKWKGKKIGDILRTENMVDFYENDSTTLNYLKNYHLLEMVKRPRIFANNNEVLIRLFISGVGYGTLTQEVARPHLESGELITLNGGQHVLDALALIWYPQFELSDYFREIIAAVK